MRLVAIGGGVAGGVGVVMGGTEASLATWIAGATGVALGGASLPLTNALVDRVNSERGLAILYPAVFFGTIAICVGAVLLVHRVIAA